MPLRRHRIVAAETAVAISDRAADRRREIRADLTTASTSARRLVAEHRRARGLLDTSAVIDLDRIDVSLLPMEVAISAITLAELAAGPHAAGDPAEVQPTPGPTATR